MIHRPARGAGAVVAPVLGPEGGKGLVAGLFGVSVILVVVPTLAFLAAFSVDVYFPNDAYFLALPVSAAVALALAVGGLVLLRAHRPRIGLFLAVVVLLGLNLGASVVASYSWFTTISCGGGYSGPCFTPLTFCGGGFALGIATAVLVGVGVFQLYRAPGPPFFAPPPRPLR